MVTRSLIKLATAPPTADPSENERQKQGSDEKRYHEIFKHQACLPLARAFSRSASIERLVASVSLPSS